MKMNLEDAEKLFRLADECGDDIAISERVMSEAHAVIVAAKDARIAELEKERDNAQDTAFDTADKLAQLALGIKNGTAKPMQVVDAFNSGIAIMEKHK